MHHAVPNDDRTAPSFWQQLEARIERKGMTKAQLARELGVSPQGLSTWKGRNQIRRECIPKVADLLKWPQLDEDSAMPIFGVEVINGRAPSREPAAPDRFQNSLRKINKTYKIYEKYFYQYARYSHQMLDSLGENGFLAFSSCTSSPYEFENSPEGQDIALAISRAISRGVLCLYIRPTEKGVLYYTSKWGYGRVVEHSEAVREMESFRAQVKKDLMRGVADRKYSPVDAERLVYERLDQCYVNRSPMWMPGIGLGMLGQFRARELTARVTISLPGGKFGGILAYPQYYALEFRFGRFLRKVVLDACREFQAVRQHGGEGPVQLIVDKQHRKSTERFYSRYSQILRTVSSIEPPDSALM